MIYLDCGTLDDFEAHVAGRHGWTLNHETQGWRRTARVPVVWITRSHSGQPDGSTHYTLMLSARCGNELVYAHIALFKGKPVAEGADQEALVAGHNAVMQRLQAAQDDLTKWLEMQDFEVRRGAYYVGERTAVKCEWSMASHYQTPDMEM